MLRRHARGQALVMGLVVLMMGTITLLYVFNTGQISADKQRTTNAADAAAYSAALWRARVLNYDAYSNRAMIANEVAIAQSMTLTSETQFMMNFAYCWAQEPSPDNGETCSSVVQYIGDIIPYVKAAFAEAAGVLNDDDRLLRPTLDAEVSGRSVSMNNSLSAAQTLLDASTNFLAVQKVVDQVTAANDSRFTSKMLPDTFAGPGGFTTQYSGTDRIRSAALVRQGLDRYSQNRGHDIVLGVDQYPVCVGWIFKKRGGTTLDSSLDRWEAADDMSEWDISLGSTGCNQKTERPLAWGDRQASGGTSDQDTGHVGDNPKALSIARDSAFRPDGYQGIEPFRDLNYAGLSGSDAQVKNPTAVLGVVTHLGAANLRTANTLDIGSGRLRMTEDLNKGELSSVAAAEVYFERPSARADGKTEYPSLFNPYWQARLTEPTVAQRAAALLL